MTNSKILLLTIIIPLILVLSGCNKNMDPNRPIGAEQKRKKNIEEGRGASLGGLLGRVGGTNYEFSSSNPMWRASLETLDFLPLTTVDYSGGVIITDWYSQDGNQDSIKLTIRFLSNEVRSDSLKIIVHKKKCKTSSNCTTNISESNLIKNELRSTILRKAALLQKSDKDKK
tara:strand:+ start:263 stop:778 length:516 start_codon:yes stop_codon:yes gene_type:complete